MSVKLSDMQNVLRAIGVKPVRSLGQNFLHDQNLARAIVEQAELSAEDYVLEIGPGLGALTEFILRAGAKVLAIEKDARLVRFLREKFASERCEILHEDALDFDARKLFAQRRVKLLGNLPYYISTELLFKFMKYPSPISLSILMLQREVAARICAAPGSSDYGVLTLLLQENFRAEFLRKVRASVFFPRPDVDSAVVQLTPRAPEELPDHDREAFAQIVRLGFSQRRKQLGKLLREFCSDWSSAAEAIGCDLQARAEQLSLEQWIALTNLVRPIEVPTPFAVQSEQFQVVDAQDRVIGIASRARVHGNNLLHRAVHVLIFNKAGEVFLQKRSRWKDREALKWDSSAAGHVNAGEDYDTAARREIQEELGVCVDPKRILKLGASSQTGHEFIWVYRAEHEGPFQTARAEIEAGEFFPTDIVSPWIKARPEDFASGFVECWKAFRAQPQN